MPRKKVPCCDCGKPSSHGKCRECLYRKPAAAARPTNGATQLGDSFTDNGVTGEVSAKTEIDVRTLEQLIEVCRIDLSVWEVERYVCNKWGVAMKQPAVGSSGQWERTSAEPIKVAIYQVKAWLRRKVQIIAARAEIAALLEDAQNHAPARPAIIHPEHGNEHMLEVSIPDVHVGKLAWAEETGHAHYDTKIAVAGYHTAVDKLIARTSAFGFSKIVLPIGNDLLNADNREQTTTRGTQQTSDGRYQKTFRIVRRMIEETIEKLRLIAPVDVIVVPGNHDTLAAWHLGDSLECLYRNTSDVQINNSANLRKYTQFGKVMLMFCHGDKGKKIDYPLVMAQEQPAMWGSTIHREIHIGHTHESKVSERHGVRTRVSPALCPPDAWHAEQMFVGNARAAEAFVWHRDEGLINLATWTVPA